MLRSMQNGVLSGFFLAIFILGVLGLVISDGGGFFRGGLSATDVAKIGDESIHISEFDRSLRMVLNQQGISTQQAYQASLIGQYLGQDLNRRAVRQESHDIGIILSEAEVAKTIELLIGPLIANGLTKEEAFDRLLQISNMSENDFIKEIRGDKSSQILYKAIGPNTVPVSDQLIEAITQFENHTRTIEFIELPHKQTAGISTPKEDELQRYYETVKSRYATAEKRDLSLMIIDNDRLKASVEISEDEIKAYYDENIDSFTNPERRELHQAIFEDEATANSVISAFNDTLEATVENITGDKKAFVGIQSFNKEDLLKEIASPVFDANNSDIVGPIKTALGWHVFQVSAILSAAQTPIDSVRADIKEAVFQDKVSEELFALAEELDERLIGGDEIATVVEELPVKQVKLDKISQLEGNRLSKLEPEDQQRVLTDSFLIDENENTPIEELSDGRFFTVYVHTIHPSVILPLEEIKEKLVNTWTKERKQAKNFADAQALISKLQNGETSISKHKPVTKTLLKTDTAPFHLSSYAMETFFNAKEGEYKLTSSLSGVVIGHVKDINIPEPKSVAKEDLEKAKEKLKAQAPQELLSAYIAHLQRVRDARINESVIAQYYGPQGQ